MKNDTITHSAINAFIADLANQYHHKSVITEAERTIFIQFSDALFSGELEALKRLVENYASNPEDAIMIFAALCRSIGVFLNDYSSCYSWTDGELYLGAISKPAKSKPYSKYNGEERHSLVLFVDGRMPNGFKNCHDDRFMSATDAKSGVVPAAESLKHFARVLTESVLRLIAEGRSDDFAPFEFTPYQLEYCLNQRQFARDKRTFATEFAKEQASRSKVSFFWWCLLNRAKIEHFGL